MAFQPSSAVLAALEPAHRKLPHWPPTGVIYFVTLRLADALPIHARARFGETRQVHAAESFAWLDRHLDAGFGCAAFANPARSLLVERTLGRSDQTRYALGPFVVMPNHVHVLVQPWGEQTIGSVVNRWKGEIARELRHCEEIGGRIWPEETVERVTRDESELRRFNDYIFGNPKAAGLEDGTYRFGRGTADWPT